MGAMHLASIHVYPVKSCHRVDVDAAEVEPWGLAGDRRWVITEPDGTTLTQRECPALTQIQPAYRPGGQLTLRTPELAELAVPEPAGTELLTVSVWGTQVPARPAGDAADEWLSGALERKVRLLWLDDPTRRQVDPRFADAEDRVSFADGFPLLLANLASLNELNGWLGEAGSVEGPLPMTRFRPNVVVAGAPAWAEDGWLGHRLRIGAVTFRVAKPCGRCVVTTTDQETGQRGAEPLRTLGRHRNVDQKLLFGVNLIPESPYGLVGSGDPVTPA